MKSLIRSIVFTAAAFAFAAHAQNLSIATGGTGGVYYPLGGGMAAVLSKYVNGMQATAEVTGGSLGTVEVGGTTDRADWVDLDELAGLPHTDIVAIGLAAHDARHPRG